MILKASGRRFAVRGALGSRANECVDACGLPPQHPPDWTNVINMCWQGGQIMILCSQTYYEIALRVRIPKTVSQIDPANLGQPSALARTNTSSLLVSSPFVIALTRRLRLGFCRGVGTLSVGDLAGGNFACGGLAGGNFGRRGRCRRELRLREACRRELCPSGTLPAGTSPARALPTHCSVGLASERMARSHNWVDPLMMMSNTIVG